MAKDRQSNVMDIIAEAEEKLEHISQTMFYAMMFLDIGPDKGSQTSVYAMHLLGVLKEAVDNVTVSLDEIGTATALSIHKPA